MTDTADPIADLDAEIMQEQHDTMTTRFLALYEDCLPTAICIDAVTCAAAHAFLSFTQRHMDEAEFIRHAEGNARILQRTARDIVRDRQRERATDSTDTDGDAFGRYFQTTPAGHA